MAEAVGSHAAEQTAMGEDAGKHVGVVLGVVLFDHKLTLSGNFNDRLPGLDGPCSKPGALRISQQAVGIEINGKGAVIVEGNAVRHKGISKGIDATAQAWRCSGADRLTGWLEQTLSAKGQQWQLRAAQRLRRNTLKHSQ